MNGKQYGLSSQNCTLLMVESLVRYKLFSPITTTLRPRASLFDLSVRTDTDFLQREAMQDQNYSMEAREVQQGMARAYVCEPS